MSAIRQSAENYSALSRRSEVVAAVQAELLAAADADRREGTRRTPQPNRSLGFADVGNADRQWIPERWPYMILCLVAAVLSAAVATRSAPGAIGTAVLAAAVGLASSLPYGAQWARGGGTTRQVVTSAGFVIAPMFLFGLGITIWTEGQGLRWDIAVAVLLWVGSISAVYLHRNAAVSFAAQLAMWAAAALIHQSVPAGLMLFVAFIVAAMVVREQVREMRAAEQRRAASERVQTRARDILADYERTRQGWFWETDRRSMLTYVSPPIAEALGFTPEQMIGQPLVSLFDLADTGPEGERTLVFHLASRSAFGELPVRSAVPGEERWWSVSGRPIFDDYDNFIGFRGSGIDLTEKHRTQEQVSRLANYDSLTGLANRFQMSQALSKILAMPQRSHRECALLMLDLDRFKRVNDTLGHPAGDALLVQVAHRLERAIGQAGQVGRLGGDEFQVIVPGRSERVELGVLANEIIASLSQPYSIDGKRVLIGVSIGIALAPDDGCESEELIRNVDLALYAAKDGGRGRFHFYAQDLHADADARFQLENDLRDAVANGGLQLHYQPVVSTASEQITGFEALLRWDHPTRGWISPDQFIGIAEDSGLIGPIGEWTLRTVCHDLANWPEDIRCGVNISPLQFANPQLSAVVTNAIAQAGIDPGRLELEITETVFLNEDEGTDAMFAALKGIGVRLALDDFGTGYSSLSYLRRAPFNKIKIDQSFVRGAAHPDSRHGAIVGSITSLANALGMETTAEGVETLDELDAARRLGCSHVQGYIYDRPLTAQAATERLGLSAKAVADGPRSERMPRRSTLRKIVIDCENRKLAGTVRNISASGAMIEGLWDVPVGASLTVHLSDRLTANAIVRWSEDDRLGVAFVHPVSAGNSSAIVAANAEPPEFQTSEGAKKAG